MTKVTNKIEIFGVDCSLAIEEIDGEWQSPKLTTKSGTIVIPAAVMSGPETLFQLSQMFDFVANRLSEKLSSDVADQTATPTGGIPYSEEGIRVLEGAREVEE